MKIEDIKSGITKVQTHSTGPILTVKYAWGKYVKLVQVDEKGNEEDMGMCPVSMLDEVKVSIG